ncbi:MAG: transcription antitermination factor NusB [Acidobacteria bacterium]|nr:MAG: transcription antitermination factor NusB [Acidobacteriota bacterium]REK03944.1 MAG: transcription antitermination factor NusB [Acidobacteriota bacterium]REK15106.1 MAG: transcription antitermination factor NusB [Acidobacteriota bacterium]REK46196.1 MAG: transcription antitermination factor NusB [Acidobacteriota bacterium]
MGARRKARECALQMLFAADVSGVTGARLISDFWNQLSSEADASTREFADNLVSGTLERLSDVDDKIRTRAEHWRIERMAVVDRNILRLAVNEFLFESTPHTVVINEALEIARRFSTYEATQFINGILDAIKQDLEKESGSSEKAAEPSEENGKSETKKATSI